MLRSIEDLERYCVQASDGEVGRVRDLYFDDTSWVVRYLEVEAGPWLSHRPLLIPPSVTGPPDWPGKILGLALTRDEVRRDPDHYTAKPVPRQRRVGFIGPAGFPYRTAGPGSWSAADRFTPAASVDPGRPGLRSGSDKDDSNGMPGGQALANASAETQAQRRADPHLRSANALQHCRIRALDGVVGQVRGLLVEENAWVVRFLIVATDDERAGDLVLIASPWILNVDWTDASIRVDLTREQVQESASYAPLQTRNHLQATAPHGP
jgi:hypothetical protein